MTYIRNLKQDNLCLVLIPMNQGSLGEKEEKN